MNLKVYTGTFIAILMAGSSLFAAPATVIVNPSSLSFGNVIQGDTSTEQSYLLTGNKKNNITIIAPAGFLVSHTSGGPYTSTLTLLPNIAVRPSSGGVIATIYVVFAPTAIQLYSGNISNVMHKFEVNANVAVSGTGVSVENPAGFTAAPGSTPTEIDLDWTKNTAEDDCMIARTLDGVFGIPVNGTIYTVNDTVSGGGLIIYTGSDLLYDDTSLTHNTLYYYKIYSVYTGGGIDPNYSSGLDSEATTTPEPGAAALLLIAALALKRKAL